MMFNLTAFQNRKALKSLVSSVYNINLEISSGEQEMEICVYEMSWNSINYKAGSEGSACLGFPF